jgi:hypothetical protein
MGGRRNTAARSSGSPGHRTGGQGGRDHRRRDVRVTEAQIARWQYTTTGMMPVVLASASLDYR